MTLRLSEMPTPFAGEAMMWAASKTWLSPGFQQDMVWVRDHGFIRFMAENTLTRFLALQIFAVGAAIVCGIPGFVWHGARALQYKVSALRDPAQAEHLNALSYEHLKAGGIDLTALFRATIYPLLSVLGIGASIGMWFSSTPVRTEYEGNPIEGQEHPDVARYWGDPSIGSIRVSPFSLLKRASIQVFEEDRFSRGALNPILGRVPPYSMNHPRVLNKAIRKSLEGKWLLDAFSIGQRSPRFRSLSQLTAFAPGNTAPAYPIPWKVIADVVKIVAFPIFFYLYVSYGVGIFFNFALAPLVLLAEGYLVLQVVAIIAGFMILLIPYFIALPFFLDSLVGCYPAIRSYLEQCREAEVSHAKSLLQIEAPNPANPPLDPNQALANTKAGLFWLKRAAEKGHGPAQIGYGAFLLASLAHYQEIPDATVAGGIRVQSRAQISLDDEEIVFAREAIAWIQAGISNADSQMGDSAEEMLKEALGLTWNDVQEGYSGDTNAEQSRSLLRNLSLNPIVREFFVQCPQKEARDRIVGVLQEAVREVQKRRRDRIVAEVMNAREENPIIPPLADIVAGYAV